MPRFRRLSAAELASPSPAGGARQKVRTEYEGYIKALSAGEGGELELLKGESRTTSKNRLKAAARALGCEIAFIRSGAGVVRFRLVAASNGGNTSSTAEEKDLNSLEIPFYSDAEVAAMLNPEPVAEEAPKPKRGRPRKQKTES